MDTVNHRMLYNTWRGMIRRCEDPRARGYMYYGDKGIRVCPEWHDFEAFKAWIMANLGPRPGGCTLDRLNGWGHYEPDNVRWATAKQQAANTTPRLRRRPLAWDLAREGDHLVLIWKDGRR